MKLIISFLLALSATIQLSGKSDDRLILKDGQILNTTIDSVSDSEISYYLKGDKSVLYVVPTEKVYMMTRNGQGNVYFSRKGKAVKGESKPANRYNNDVIYLLYGEEISAKDVKIDNNGVHYRIPSTENNDNPFASLSPETGRINKFEVFMVCFKSGKKEIINPLSSSAVHPTAHDVKKQSVQMPETVVQQTAVPETALASAETRTKIPDTFDNAPSDDVLEEDLKPSEPSKPSKDSSPTEAPKTKDSDTNADQLLKVGLTGEVAWQFNSGENYNIYAGGGTAGVNYHMFNVFYVGGRLGFNISSSSYGSGTYRTETSGWGIYLPVEIGATLFGSSSKFDIAPYVGLDLGYTISMKIDDTKVDLEPKQRFTRGMRIGARIKIFDYAIGYAYLMGLGDSSEGMSVITISCELF